MGAIDEFCSRYTSARDRARISFAWNGKHADQFEDANFRFRQRVLKVVLADLHRAPIELVRELYDAETAWAKEAWGVNLQAVRALAEELLTRGGTEFVEDFLAGKFGRGMDASGAAYFQCPRELAERLLAEVERRLAVGAEGDRRKLLEAGRAVFREWVEDAPK
jgi:hypothetical protein